MAPLPPSPHPCRHWTEETLDEACRLVLGEVTIPGAAPGGRVEFRRTLLVSFLFRFYLQVSQSLSRMVGGLVALALCGDPD